MTNGVQGLFALQDIKAIMLLHNAINSMMVEEQTDKST